MITPADRARQEETAAQNNRILLALAMVHDDDVAALYRAMREMKPSDAVNATGGGAPVLSVMLTEKVGDSNDELKRRCGLAAAAVLNVAANSKANSTAIDSAKEVTAVDGTTWKDKVQTVVDVAAVLAGTVGPFLMKAPDPRIKALGAVLTGAALGAGIERVTDKDVPASEKGTAKAKPKPDDWTGPNKAADKVPLGEFE